MADPRPIILDCDPGIDDFIAILMILASPQHFNLLGITVTSGNVPVEYTAHNALRACELAGRNDVPVYQGAPKPLLREHQYDPAVYGESGLKGADLPVPMRPIENIHAVDFLIEAILSSSHKVTLLATAPLTNIALAIVREPSILKNIEEIVVMGGAMTLGNITPAAEYNFFADPEAAHILFTSGAKIKSIGLEVTHHVVTSLPWFDELDKINNPVSQTLVAMLREFYEYDMKNFELSGGAIHDPCVVAYLLEPELFKGHDVYVEIDTSFSDTRGRSTIDWWGKHGFEPNAYVFNKVDVNGFFKLLTNLLRQFSEVQP